MRRKKQESGIEYDEKLLQHIAPIGNMTPYNSYCRTGTGYEACVHTLFPFDNTNYRGSYFEREQGMKHVFIFFHYQRC